MQHELMDTNESHILADLVRKKVECLTRLRAMSEKQLALVSQGSMMLLLDVLSAKQRALAELQQIERALDPFRGQDPQRRRWRTPEERTQCGDHLKRCERLLSEIMVRERQSEHALVRRREEVAAQLEGAHLATQALGAYVVPPQGGAQLDLMSET